MRTRRDDEDLENQGGFYPSKIKGKKEGNKQPTECKGEKTKKKNSFSVPQVVTFRRDMIGRWENQMGKIKNEKVKKLDIKPAR